MIIPYLPIEGLHDFNLDWFLRKFRELSEEWDATKAAWFALKAWVEDYFENLDVQEEINNKIDEMYENGELGRLLSQLINVTTSPKIVTSIAQMTDKDTIYVLRPSGDIYYYTGDAWTNSGMQYGQTMKAITSSDVVVSVGNVGQYDDLDTYEDNKIYAILVNAMDNIEHKPPLNHYYNAFLITLTYGGSNANIQLWYDVAGNIYHRFKYAGVYQKWYNTTNGGELITDTVDLNELPENTTYAITSRATPTNTPKIGDNPVTGVNAMVTTLAYNMDNAAGAVQWYIADGIVMHRMKWGGKWYKWVKDSRTTYQNLTVDTDINSLDDGFYVKPANVKLLNLNTPTIYDDFFNIQNDVWLVEISSTMQLQRGGTKQRIYGNSFELVRFKASTTGAWLGWYTEGDMNGLGAFLSEALLAADNPVLPLYKNAHNPIGKYALYSDAVNTTDETKYHNLPMSGTPQIIETTHRPRFFNDGNLPDYGMVQQAHCVESGSHFIRSVYNPAVKWGWQDISNNNPYGIGDYSSRNFFLKPNQKILWLGDSLSTTIGGGQSIPTQFLNRLSSSSGVTVVNRAVASATISTNSDDPDNRIINQIHNDDVFGLEGYRMVVIWAGTNDAQRNNDIPTLKNDIRLLVEKIKSQKLSSFCLLYIGIPNTWTMGRFNFNLYEGIIFNELLYQTRMVDPTFAQMTYITLRDTPYIPHSWFNQDNNDYYNTCTNDGIHPNKFGKIILTSAIISKLSSFELSQVMPAP